MALGNTRESWKIMESIEKKVVFIKEVKGALKKVTKFFKGLSSLSTKPLLHGILKFLQTPKPKW